MLEINFDPFDPPRDKASTRSVAPMLYGTIALMALGALGVEFFVGFGLGFAPGWANGWLGGRLAIHEVWSAGMTTILFSILVTGTIGLGAVLGLLLSRLTTTRRHAGTVFGAWIVAGAILALVASPSLHRAIHASAIEMWPNGYNP